MTVILGVFETENARNGFLNHLEWRHVQLKGTITYRTGGEVLHKVVKALLFQRILQEVDGRIYKLTNPGLFPTALN